MQVAIMEASDFAADPALLTPAEGVAFAAVRGARRRAEWIRGRLAIRRLLGDGASVIVAPDGAPQVVVAGTSVVVAPDRTPQVVGAAANVSLSHDGTWIAVAITDAQTTVGIDLCVRSHGDRIAKILRWLEVDSDVPDPVAQWTALEAVLKLRRLSIEALRERPLALRARGATIEVRGLREPAHVRLRTEPAFVVAWTFEPMRAPHPAQSAHLGQPAQRAHLGVHGLAERRATVPR